MKDACELARALPVDGGGAGVGGGRPQAVGVTVKQPLGPQDAVILSAASTGGPACGCRCGRCGTMYNSSCGWRGTSKAKPQARKNEHRKFCRSFMPLDRK